MKLAWVVVSVLVACSHPGPPASRAAIAEPAAPHPATPASLTAPAPRRPITLSILGTNDLHGAIERLPIFGGFVANVRAARQADGGGVVLVDGGDMFQGTLESNIAEGADIVTAYNELGYAAAAVGNHEFDYGPVGPAATAATREDDPRGALKARASEARFPFVVANILDAATGARIAWPNMPPSTLIEVAGVRIGIVGASTEATPFTTMPANFAGLRMAPAAQAITEQAQALRGKGAQVIIAAMHIGSSCKEFSHPDDSSSCDRSDELFRLLATVPRGTLDVIVGGHTHAGMAHRIDGVAVIESYATGRAFGRVDLRIGGDGALIDTHIDPPHLLCHGDDKPIPVAIAACAPGDYEGRPVMPASAVQRIVDAAVARASVRRKEKLGVTLPRAVTREWAAESPEGNWFCDLMLAARPEVQIAMTNGGGLRADLPPGELTYGQLFEALPFDNRFAIVDLTGADLRKLVIGNLSRGGAILSWGGLTAKVRCTAGALDAEIRVAGKPLVDAAHYKLATSDFLASGGDGVIGRLGLPTGAIQLTDAIIREALGDVLRSRKRSPAAAPGAIIDVARLYSAAAPRLDYEGTRPVACAQNQSSATSKEPAK
jgi:5'-nucleotidase